MISVCLYFQVHQPMRLNQGYSFFDIGLGHDYRDDTANRDILRKVADKCYLPANRLMLDLINEFKGKFRISYAITGVAMEQFQEFCPEVLESFRALAETGCVEFIGETHYHSLSFLFSKEEFRRQVKMHDKVLKEFFGVKPVTFRNTELIYSNDLALEVEKMGYKTILAEGADHVLGWRSPNFVYQPAGCCKLKALLKNYRLSDDVAFRFSDQGWSEWPVTAERFAKWVHAVAGNGEVVNLFMDYETIGEHQWAETGIFEFFRALPGAILDHPDFTFKTPCEAAAGLDPKAQIDVPHFTSWADLERDVTAWLGNPMQDQAAELAYALEDRVLATGDDDLIATWRELLTSDHFYYMCTKWFSDGDVHKYFNPYETPHQAFITYMNALNDLTLTVDRRLGNK
ncbi:MAG: glycoside hydrolase family 57 protein [Pseudodesulfovibrio sp.]|uniref:Alpha-amylase n=1 Tax=Pseudodesulfovibrio aespoeensis (strain ATCC 700646 / DSM 10631 / Aspo-2) TaxID=643562 RepID=E6VWU2_PSEA9|nr:MULTISPECIES: glycoside hydrolase family 57 protein [Pseudodesulfovibrio]MBU4242849.1 glycoside hydrolase family 57 protein [Pseudomonadota bacterium]ADU63704.1 Alpha-amylase [Pseudodesulfovibrio aespoeensis Aspo-2]MBU4379646.1 glycoside hydrolase family 57 protein [Pseudomonadota bacterium]MBU4476358.1 glycoside hydrolase family 57 protein [Pseudomonadota bacterium]MBU4515446.1 glycoside hydrolase family 57 protein [Pseudomonadota bacterium]